VKKYIFIVQDQSEKDSHWQDLQTQN